ncbi:protofilament ribbon, putative, partial [Ichthyophthirius multifiliis]
EITKMRTHLEKTLLDKHRRWEINCKEFNPQQMKEKFDNERAKNDIEQEQSKHHINYCMTNQFQTESSQTCQSSLAKHRVIPYHWKGMNDYQRREVILQQDQQRKENEMLKKIELDYEKAYALQTEHNRFMLINLERHKNRQHKQNMNDIKEWNLQKAKEQKIKLKHMYD